MVSGRRTPEDFIGHDDKELEIPRDIDQKIVRTIYGRKDSSLYMSLKSEQLNIILRMRDHGAYAFLTVGEYGMIDFDPSCVDLNLEGMYACATELSKTGWDF